MEIGDIVLPIRGKFFLRSGCGQYEFAVVVSVDPFALVSEHADMLWIATIKPEYFKAIGTAEPKMLRGCLKRWEEHKKEWKL